MRWSGCLVSPDFFPSKIRLAPIPFVAHGMGLGDQMVAMQVLEYP